VEDDQTGDWSSYSISLPGYPGGIDLSEWERRNPCRQSGHSVSAHTYIEGPRGKNDNEVSYINDGSSPLSAFLLYFAEIITLSLLP